MTMSELNLTTRTCPRTDYEPMTAETVAVLECELPATHGGQCRTTDEKILRWEDWL